MAKKTLLYSAIILAPCLFLFPREILATESTDTCATQTTKGNNCEKDFFANDIIRNDASPLKLNKTFSLGNENGEILYAGVFGTSQWTIRSNGTLYIESGKFGEGRYQSPWDSYRSIIKKIEFLGRVEANENSSYLFASLDQVTEIKGMELLDTKQVNNMGMMFGGMKNLLELDVTSFDTSNVTDMGSMFSDMTKLTSLNLSSFNTSKVTDMGQMFSGLSSIETLDLMNFDTKNVVNMRSMFGGMKRLQSLDLSHFDTKNVKNMSWMFQVMPQLTKLNISGFNTSKVTTMTGMFYGLSSLTNLDIANFDTSNVTNMSHMFSGMRSVTNLDVSKFKTSNVISMEDMFYSVDNVTELDVSRFDTSKVTNMSRMFEMSRLEHLDVSNFDTSNVTKMLGMFANTDLTNLDVSSFNTSKVTTMRYMFNLMDSLERIDISNFDMSKVTKTNMEDMFRFTRLKSIKLGEKTRLYPSVNLVPISVSPFIGRWVHVESDQKLNFNELVPGEYVSAVKPVINSKDITLYTGDTWTPFDNFVSASNYSGAPLSLENIKVDSNVNTSQPGTYEVTYKYGHDLGTGAYSSAKVTVKENLAAVKVHDSTIYAGDEWEPSYNFDSARDKNGQPISFDQIIVDASQVDTSKAGVYEVLYTYEGVSSTAKVTVKENQTAVNVHNSTNGISKNDKTVQVAQTVSEKTNKSNQKNNIKRMISSSNAFDIYIKEANKFQAIVKKDASFGKIYTFPRTGENKVVSSILLKMGYFIITLCIIAVFVFVKREKKHS